MSRNSEFNPSSALNQGSINEKINAEAKAANNFATNLKAAMRGQEMNFKEIKSLRLGRQNLQESLGDLVSEGLLKRKQVRGEFIYYFEN